MKKLFIMLFSLAMGLFTAQQTSAQEPTTKKTETKKAETKKVEAPKPTQTPSMVYVCDSKAAQKYHVDKNCTGLNKCTSKVLSLKIGQAKSQKKSACAICAGGKKKAATKKASTDAKKKADTKTKATDTKKTDNTTK